MAPDLTARSEGYPLYPESAGRPNPARRWQTGTGCSGSHPVRQESQAAGQTQLAAPPRPL